MATFYGADVEQLRQLGREFNQQADQLEAVLNRINARIDSSAWRGPDAEGFRSDWNGRLSPSIRSALRVLQDVSGQVLVNAQQQEQASGGSASMPTIHGGAMDLRSPVTVPPQWAIQEITFGDFLDETGRVVEQSLPGLPWSLNDLGGVVPGVSEALNIRDIVDGFSDGQFPIHEIVDGTRGAIQGLGPVGYWGSAAIGTWDLALQELEKADLSQSQFDRNMEYLRSNTGDALAGAGEAIVKFLPSLIGIFK